MWEENMVPFIISHWLAKCDSSTSFPFPPPTVLHNSQTGLCIVSETVFLATLHMMICKSSLYSFKTLRFIFTDGHQKIKKEKKKSGKVMTTLI